MLQVMIRVKNAIRKKVSDIKKIWKRKVVVLYCNTSFAHIGYAVEDDCCTQKISCAGLR